MQTSQEGRNPGKADDSDGARLQNAQAVRQIYGDGWEALVTALQLMSQIVVVLDRDAQVVFANHSARGRWSAMADTFPSERDQFLALMRPLDLQGQPLPKEQWPSVRALRGEFGFEEELQFQLLSDGQRYRCKFSFSPLKDTRSVIVGAMVVCEVHTSTRSAMEIARRYRQLIHATVSNMQVGLLVEDLNGEIILANPAAKRIFGVPDQDWPPKSKQHLAERYKTFNESNLEITMEERPLSCALRGETGVKDIHYVKRTDPTARKISVSCSYAPILDSSGRIRGGVVTAHDITDGLELRSQLQESQRTLRSLLAKEHLATEHERQRIARELHDDLQQQLGAIRLNMLEINRQASHSPDVVMALAELTASITDQALESLRRIVRGLRPQMLDDLGLQSALESMINQFQRSSQLTVEFEAQDPHHLTAKLPAEISTNLYRVVQESLNNIRKHAGASFVYVLLDLSSNHEVHLRIQDDGVGPYKRPQRGERPLGLLGMAERVQILGGTLEVRAASDGGTVVEVRVPLQAALFESGAQ